MKIINRSHFVVLIMCLGTGCKSSSTTEPQVKAPDERARELMGELQRTVGISEQEAIGAKLAEIRGQTSNAMRKEIDFFLVDFFGPDVAKAMLKKGANKSVDQTPDTKSRGELK